MDIKNFFQTSFASRKTAFYLNLLGLTMAFTIFYILMSEVMWVKDFDAFHRDADRIYRIHSNMLDQNNQSSNINMPSIVELLKYSPDVESGVSFGTRRGGSQAIAPADTTIGTEMIDAYFYYIYGDLTKVFTFDMIEGNEESISDPANALIPLSLAKKLYGDKRPYAGRIFGTTQWSLKVGGVYRDFPTNSIMSNDVYQLIEERAYNDYMNNGRNWNYPCYVRLKKGADPTQIFKNFVRDHPNLYGNQNKDAEQITITERCFTLFPLKDIYFLPINMGGMGHSHNITTLYFIIACFILLIAAINYMNFVLASVPNRIKEINIRKILGSSNHALRLVLIAEEFFTVIISLFFALGILCVLIKGGYINMYLKSDLAFDRNYFLLACMALLTMVITLCSGLYPAYYMTSRKPAMVVNGSFSLSPAGRLFRKYLIGVQFTVSLVIIMIVLLMNSQHLYMLNCSVGYARDSILYVCPGGNLRNNYKDAFMERLRTNPDIKDASWCAYRLGEWDGGMGWGRDYEGQNIFFQIHSVQPNFLRTMGIQVTEGRDFREEDSKQQLGVFIFNETARKQYNLKLNTSIGNQGEIIGFMPDIKFGTFRNEVIPMAFHVWGTENWGTLDYNCAIRVNSPKKIPDVRSFVQKVCKELTGYDQHSFYTKEELINITYKEEHTQTRMVLFDSIISLLISVIGVFGLVLFETQAKRKEIGIRKVFGASTIGILLMFNKHYLKMLIVCFIAATPVAYYLYSIWLENFAYHTTLQGWLFIIAFLIVAIIVCGTVTIQSWKAARELPVDVLNK